MIPIQSKKLLEVKKETCFEKPSLVEEIPFLLQKFQTRSGEWITRNAQQITQNGRHYYGVHKNAIEQPSGFSETEHLHQELKAHILQNMGLPANTKVVQVVGDSLPYSQTGTEMAKELLRQKITSDCMVLYGYTGHAKQDGTRCVNAALSDIVQEKELMDKTVGNLVGFHTLQALQNWGCSGPDLSHYIVVYGDDDSKRDTGTVFGDDILVSDSIHDELLMVEGGVQSFAQACNTLQRGIPIAILTGLRTEASAYAIEDDVRTPYFAAAQFMKDVIAFMDQTSNAMDWDSFYRGYFGKGRCYLADPKRADYDTKQKLMDCAWAQFLEEKLYLKIRELVTYPQ